MQCTCNSHSKLKESPSVKLFPLLTQLQPHQPSYTQLILFLVVGIVLSYFSGFIFSQFTAQLFSRTIKLSFLQSLIMKIGSMRVSFLNRSLTFLFPINLVTTTVGLLIF